MSLFFPRSQELSPLFRLADEFDRATRTSFNGSNHNMRSFAPRFDVKETKDVYELHGELPGIEQDQINIEWSDDNTLTISGQTEHRHKFSNVDEAPEGEQKADEDGYNKPTIEDEGEESGDKADSTVVTKTSQTKEVARADDNAPKYWVTERSFGSFHRTFQFPSRVDHDSVIANLKNGILSVTIPKAKATQSRRIQIS